MIVTDSIKIPKDKMIPKIQIAPLAPFIREIINCIYEGEPMGVIVEKKYEQINDE